MKTIGFIGLGIMGESMCERIMAAGYPVIAFDVDRDRVTAMEKKSARAAESLADVASATETIITMVPASEHVEAIVKNILPHIKKGSLLVEMSTISPAVSKHCADLIAKRGSRMIDAPVIKSKAAAISGDLGILVGGKRADFEAALPILQCMGKNIIHMGPNGTGLAMKICHNLLVAEIQNGVNEMLVLANQCGLVFDDVIAAIKAGGGQNFYLDTKAASIKDRDFAPKFPFEHMHKDLGIAKDLCSSIGLKLPGAKLVRSIYKKGIKRALGRKDFSAAYEIVESQSR